MKIHLFYLAKICIDVSTTHSLNNYKNCIHEKCLIHKIDPHHSSIQVNASVFFPGVSATWQHIPCLSDRHYAYWQCSRVGPELKPHNCDIMITSLIYDQVYLSFLSLQFRKRKDHIQFKRIPVGIGF